MFNMCFIYFTWQILKEYSLASHFKLFVVQYSIDVIEKIMMSCVFMINL